MKRGSERALIASFLLVLIVKTTLADVIDFKGLQRPGRPAVKTYPIPGLYKESSEWFHSFSDSDSQERKATADAIRAHESDNQQCNRSGRCYQIKEVRRDRVEVLCLAGMSKGSTEWVSVASNGKQYNCNPLGCDSTLHKGALSVCHLSE